MSKDKRLVAKALPSEDLSEPAKLSPSELLSEHHRYDPENYDPIKNLQDKEVLLPKKRSNVVTIRLTPSENQQISDLADENGLSKSAFIRMVVKNALKREDYHS